MQHNIASSISLRLAMPVEISMGLCLDAAYSIKGISVSSKEAILYAGVSNFSRRSIAVSSKGEEKIVRPNSLA